MVKPKGRPAAASVRPFIASQPEAVRRDCRSLVTLMQKVSGLKPKMWGSAMIGFGRYYYTYLSGHEGDTVMLWFSSRPSGLSPYLSCGYPTAGDLLLKLGEHGKTKGCLCIRKLSDIRLPVIEELLRGAFAKVKKWSAAAP